MCHSPLLSSRFFQMLIDLDQSLALQTCDAGCPYCGGVLHRANYPRKPRGCPCEWRDAFSSRFSFCCAQCRRRSTSRSVRFFGRRVYLMLAVVLGAARHVTRSAVATALCADLAVPPRTLERWRCWWRDRFLLTPLWQCMAARFVPPPLPHQLPASLLDRFTGAAPHEPLLRLLVFLAPLSRGICLLHEGRSFPAEDAHVLIP